MVVETGNRVSLDHLETAGEINRHDGGRGIDFPDPDGHLLEIITRPYGSG